MALPRKRHFFAIIFAMKTYLPFSHLALVKKGYPKKRIVLAGGAFDLIHPGHIKHLSWAASLGDILIVHITGDKRYIKKRARKPVFAESERASMVGSLKPVDHVFIYNGRHYDKKVLKLLMPDILVFHEEAYTEVVKNKLKVSDYRGKIRVSKFKKKYSSSTLLNSRKDQP